MKKLPMALVSFSLIFLLSSCGDKYLTTHKPFNLLPNCAFEKFTEEEKNSMTEQVGKKISRNQNGCTSRQMRNESNAKAHNDAHLDK